MFALIRDMTSEAFETAECPLCGQKQEFAYFASLNVTEHPQLKEKLFSGDLHIVHCERCRQRIHFQSPLLYHDMDKRLLIELTYDPERTWLTPLQKEKCRIVDGMFADQGYTMRIATSEDELFEKIKIFDHQLNDKMVELVKYGILLKEKDKEKKLFFERLEKDSEGAELYVFYEYLEEGILAYKPFLKRGVKPFEEILSKIPRGNKLHEGEWLYINRQWILDNLYEVYGKNGNK